MKKCYNCGAGVPDNAKFCAKCGKPLEITQDLIDRAKAGDSAAQTELYQRTYKIVYAKTRAKFSDEDTVMDIMQETYLRAFTNLDQLKKAETFPSWLLTIASRQACDWYRKNGKEQQNIQLSQLEYEDDETLSDENDLFDKPEDRSDLIPDEALDRAETGRLLSEILDTLPEDQRMILTMFYYDDMSLNEISEELGVNLSTVKSRLTAGKKKVKAKVLELEKSGTKLYSLGPVAFLVYLLRHAELFAPEISSNTILGLTGTGAAAGGVSAAASAGSTAAGGASTGAGGAVSGGVSAGGAASNIAGGTAAKASVAAAAKGISVRAAVAIVAAAVVVAGGGITTAVVVTNNNEQLGSETAVVETPNNENEPPTEEIIHELVDGMAFWSVNSMGSDAIDYGPITPNVNQAAELAAGSYWYENRENVDSGMEDYFENGLSGEMIPKSALRELLRNMFGDKFDLDNFTNGEYKAGEPISPGSSLTYGSRYLSAFETICNLGDLSMSLFEKNGQFIYSVPATEGFGEPENVEVENISEADSEGYIADVEYVYTLCYSSYYGDVIETHARDVEYTLVPDNSSDFGWVISQIAYKKYHDLETEEKEVNGKAIKSMTVKDKDGTISEYHTYDRNGNDLTCVYYDEDGNITSQNEYEYDSDGNVVASIEYGDDGKVSDRYEYTYDNEGKKLSETYYDGDGNVTGWLERTYNDSGNIKMDTEYNSEGDISDRIEFTYGDNGYRLSTHYDGDGIVYSRDEQVYDSNGNLLSTKTYFEDTDGISGWNEYTYDNKGNVLTRVGYSSHDRTEHTYDSAGNISSILWYKDDGNLYRDSEFEYDQDGNVQTLIRYNGDGSIYSYASYEYEYYD